MNLLTNSTALGLWRETVRHAEESCCISLNEDLEAYLVSLLIRYTNKPEILKQVLAMAFLEALQLRENQRLASLQHVGDQCLLFAGLFPRIAEKKRVRINYFVDLGRSAYAAVSHDTNDLFNSLAVQFVLLMDVLQSIRASSNLSPLEAYDQWNEVGSQRALKILNEYTHSMPIKNRPNHSR